MAVGGSLANAAGNIAGRGIDYHMNGGTSDDTTSFSYSGSHGGTYTSTKTGNTPPTLDY